MTSAVSKPESLKESNHEPSAMHVFNNLRQALLAGSLPANGKPEPTKRAILVPIVSRSLENVT